MRRRSEVTLRVCTAVRDDRVPTLLEKTKAVSCRQRSSACCVAEEAE